MSSQLHARAPFLAPPCETLMAPKKSNRAVTSRAAPCPKTPTSFFCRCWTLELHGCWKGKKRGTACPVSWASHEAFFGVFRRVKCPTTSRLLTPDAVENRFIADAENIRPRPSAPETWVTYNANDQNAQRGHLEKYSQFLAAAPTLCKNAF